MVASRIQAADGLFSKPKAQKAFAEVRKQFPTCSEWIYMDVAGRGILSKPVRAAIEAHLDNAQKDGGDKDAYFAKIEEVREKIGSLLNATADEIAITKNVSEGINIIANAIPWKKGDNVVLCPEIEHPNNIYPWLNLKERGVEVRMVSAPEGIIVPENVIAAMNSHTRVVTVSSISFSPGYRTMLSPIGSVCRDRGVFFLIDAAQSVGIISHDVAAEEIDGMVASTHKGVLGLYGMGFLYCRQEWADSLRPVYLARFSVDIEDNPEWAMGGYDYRLCKGARRFDIGNYNYLGAYAAGEALNMHLSIGIKNIEAYVLFLANKLFDGLKQRGVSVYGAGGEPHGSSIVTIGKWGKGDHYTSDDKQINALYEILEKNHVCVSLRRGLIRFSLHCYNNEDDVSRVFSLIDKAKIT